MDRMILPLLGVVLLLTMGVASGLAWDRHGPCCHINLLFWSPGFAVHDSLATRLYLAELDARQAHLDIADLHRRSTVAITTASAAVQAAAPAVHRLQASADRLQASVAALPAPTPPGDCPRWTAADVDVQKALTQ